MVLSELLTNCVLYLPAILSWLLPMPLVGALAAGVLAWLAAVLRGSLSSGDRSVTRNAGEFDELKIKN